MEESRVIGFFGCGQTDICVYLANILENMKKHVLVIDNSFEQKMRFCIPRPEEQLDIVTFREVDYGVRLPSEQWKSMDYEYILVDMGSLPEEEGLALCDEFFLVTGCERAQLEVYREVMRKSARPGNVIFRGFCRNYMDGRKISEQMENENCFVLEKFFLPFSEADECSRVLMQYEGYQNFLYISHEFERMLVRIARTITQIEYPAVLGGVRSAKRGGVS